MLWRRNDRHQQARDAARKRIAAEQNAARQRVLDLAQTDPPPSPPHPARATDDAPPYTRALPRS